MSIRTSRELATCVKRKGTGNKAALRRLGRLKKTNQSLMVTVIPVERKGVKMMIVGKAKGQELKKQ